MHKQSISTSNIFGSTTMRLNSKLRKEEGKTWSIMKAIMNVNEKNKSLRKIKLIYTRHIDAMKAFSNDQKKKMKYYTKLKEENDNFIQNFRGSQKMNDWAKKKKKAATSTAFSEETFTELILKYKSKGYKIPDLTLQHNLFQPSPLLLENEKIGDYYHGLKNGKHATDKNLTHLVRLSRAVHTSLVENEMNKRRFKENIDFERKLERRASLMNMPSDENKNKNYKKENKELIRYNQAMERLVESKPGIMTAGMTCNNSLNRSKWKFKDRDEDEEIDHKNSTHNATVFSNTTAKSKTYYKTSQYFKYMSNKDIISAPLKQNILDSNYLLSSYSTNGNFRQNNKSHSIIKEDPQNKSEAMRFFMNVPSSPIHQRITSLLSTSDIHAQALTSPTNQQKEFAEIGENQKVRSHFHSPRTDFLEDAYTKLSNKDLSSLDDIIKTYAKNKMNLTDKEVKKMLDKNRITPQGLMNNILSIQMKTEMFNVYDKFKMNYNAIGKLEEAHPLLMKIREADSKLGKLDLELAEKISSNY